jgi:hypothetical protein
VSPPIVTPVLASFSLPGLLDMLLWAVWMVLNFWLFQKTKAIANLLMLVASAYMTLVTIVRWFAADPLGGPWMGFVAFFLLTLGFFLSVRAQVEAQLARLRQRVADMATGKKDGGGSAPPPPPPPGTPSA